MFLIDDILLFPVNSVFWIFRELHNAVQQEVSSESQTITNQLSELYMLLETGQISEEEFAAKEEVLLDRLEELSEDNLDDDADDDTDSDDDSDDWD